MEKEFLYVGHYIDTEGNYILKIGTTNNLKRRAQEHTTNYRKVKKHTLSK
jgi:predicted GIY-YIG superfamily endonuclease